MPGLLTQGNASLSFNFNNITAGHTVDIANIQYLPATEGGRKLLAVLNIDTGGGTPISFELSIGIRDVVYDDFGLYGQKLDADDRRKLANKF